MIKVLENAIERVKLLPEDRQAYVAHVLDQLAIDDDAVFHVPESHRAAILEGLGQVKRNEFASDDAVMDMMRKPWE